MASTDTILARLCARKTNPTKELSVDVSDVSDVLDVPRLQPNPVNDLGNKLAEMLGSSMSQQHSPMD